MDTYPTEDIVRQLRLGEDSGWEFKQIEFAGNRPNHPRCDDLADEVAAFANSDGGVLLCGVTCRGVVQGMTRPQMDALERLLVEICDAIKPPVRPTILRREIEEGKPFLLVSVSRGEAQHDSPGGSFQRVGSSKRAMTGDERLRLAQRRGQARFLWFDKQTVPETGFGTLDDALWKPLLSAQGADNPALALEKMGLLARGANETVQATVTGLLLCSRTPHEWLPNACITATQYRGVDRASGQLDSQTITGPLSRQIVEAVAFAVRNMRVGAYKSPARIDLPQYSERALFEAIVNAVAHRDYSIRGSRIRLSMFADRIEINSPGGLANNLTVDDMAMRQSTRNEALASALGRLPVGTVRGAGDRRYFMERRGDGVPTIMRETRALSGEVAQYRLLANSDLFLTIPAAETVPTPVKAVISARSRGNALPNVNLLVLYPNESWVPATTDASGEASVDLHISHLPLTVFAAVPGYAAHLTRNWQPRGGALTIELEPLPEGGAVIFPEGTGEVPGLAGRLSPVRDPLDRTCLHTSHITVNQGQTQPVPFLLGESLRLTDAEGNERTARIVDVMGQAALVEYRPVGAETLP